MTDSRSFELTMQGGPVERRYRQLSPDIESMPWGALEREASARDAHAVDTARGVWTIAAYREHRAAAAAAATVSALVSAGAPVDLIGVATRFPLDELIHAELCARITGELGGAADLRVPEETFATTSESPLLNACLLTVQHFCLGESFSHPLVRETWRFARQDLVKQVARRMMRDDAAHAQFGWLVMDWADERLSEEDRAELSDVVTDGVHTLWSYVCDYDPAPMTTQDDAAFFGWLPGPRYQELARMSLTENILPGLASYGIEPHELPF